MHGFSSPIWQKRWVYFYLASSFLFPLSCHTDYFTVFRNEIKKRGDSISRESCSIRLFQCNFFIFIYKESCNYWYAWQCLFWACTQYVIKGFRTIKYLRFRFTTEKKTKMLVILWYASYTLYQTIHKHVKKPFSSLTNCKDCLWLPFLPMVYDYYNEKLLWTKIWHDKTVSIFF